jgi:uncharacterized secreted protein with C-terminal beta-propeller domain
MEWGNAHVSLYDLSDFAAPTLVDRHFFDSDESTPALWNHKAFTYAAPLGLVALPYTVGTWQSGVRLIDVGADGLAPRGDLALGGSEGAVAPAIRAHVVGDTAYAVSRCRITSAAIDAPAAALATAALFEGGTCDDENPWGI